MASLRICVSAGEALPRATWEAWQKATGIEILDGIGSTEMLHIFIGAPAGKIKPGATGIPVPGYEAKIVDEEGRELPRGSVGLLAVRGPTGCRYLADPRQTVYVRDGWNFTGDTYRLDEDGYYWHQARSDDMIVSAGYNIAGPEVEGALLSHPSVLECAVVGAPDLAHDTTIVKAYVVPRPGQQADAAFVAALQDHVTRRDRALQMPARHQLRRGAAAHRIRQGAAFRAARACQGRSREGSLDVSPPNKPIVVPALVPEDEAGPKSLNPRGWPRPKGYANGMTAQGRVVLTGGVVGWDEMGRFPEGFVAQALRCFLNIRAILAEGGAEPRHLVRLTWYVTDVDAYLADAKALGEAYRSAFGRHYPAMAVVEVKRLVEKSALLEIEATAIVPN